MTTDEKKALFEDFISFLESKENKNEPITVRKTVTEQMSECEAFKVGDVIDFTLSTGEKVSAMAMKQQKDGMIFAFVDCLSDKYSMNDKNTNEGGYAESEMRRFLGEDLYDRFPATIKDKMVTFDNGDYLRLMTEKEVFGENFYGEDEGDEVEQFEPMKLRRNRIALQGKNGSPDWYWLANKVKDSAAYFADVSYLGYVDCGSAPASFGVRPAFLLSYKWR